MSEQQLREVMEALEEAVREEQPIRFGHEVARTIFVALTEAEMARAARDREAAEKPHEHVWSTLGWDRPDDNASARIVQLCGCGAARDVAAEYAP